MISSEFYSRRSWFRKEYSLVITATLDEFESALGPARVHDRILAWRLRRCRKATHLGLRVTCDVLPDRRVQDVMRERYRGELGRILDGLQWFMGFHDQAGKWLEEIVVTPHLSGEMLMGQQWREAGPSRR